MKVSRLIALIAICLTLSVGTGLLVNVAAQFQSGQKVLTGFPAQGQIPIDNGGPMFTVLPQAAGTVTLNGATPVTVANAAVTSGSIIVFTLKTVAGTVSPNAPNVLTITPGTGFTVGGTAVDTSVYNYVILG